MKSSYFPGWLLMLVVGIAAAALSKLVVVGGKHPIEAEEVEVTAIDPIASMQAVKNPDLLPIAQQVQRKLKTVVKNS